MAQNLHSENMTLKVADIPFSYTANKADSLVLRKAVADKGFHPIYVQTVNEHLNVLLHMEIETRENGSKLVSLTAISKNNKVVDGAIKRIIAVVNPELEAATIRQKIPALSEAEVNLLKTPVEVHIADNLTFSKRGDYAIARIQLLLTIAGLLIPLVQMSRVSLTSIVNDRQIGLFRQVRSGVHPPGKWLTGKWAAYLLSSIILSTTYVIGIELWMYLYSLLADFILSSDSYRSASSALTQVNSLVIDVVMAWRSINVIEHFMLWGLLTANLVSFMSLVFLLSTLASNTYHARLFEIIPVLLIALLVIIEFADNVFWRLLPIDNTRIILAEMVNGRAGSTLVFPGIIGPLLLASAAFWLSKTCIKKN